MKIKRKLVDLYETCQGLLTEGTKTNDPMQSPELKDIITDILYGFSHEPIECPNDIFLRFMSAEKLTDNLIKETVIALARSCAQKMTKERMEDLDQYIGELPEGENLPEEELCEEIDLEEGDDEILNRALEKAMGKIKANRAQETINTPEANENEETTANVDDMFSYVKAHIYVPLDRKEFDTIEIGFRMLWNHASGQMLGDYDFKRAADQYLTSIESPIDRKKMEKVVDLILEYLHEMGEYDDSFDS